MDALEFLKEERRMCNSFDIGCVKCPLGDIGCFVVSPEETDEEFEREIATVERWSKEHPYKTRQSVFLKQYPEARLGDDGVLQIDPCPISASYRNARNNCATMRRECSDCRREFWSAEVEE